MGSKKMMTVGQMEDKYQTLVWYARKPRHECGGSDMELARKYFPNTPEDILQGMIEGIKEAEETYPKEIALLNSPIGDWTHGFNSGMLAALRLFKGTTKISAKALEEFPELDT